MTPFCNCQTAADCAYGHCGIKFALCRGDLAHPRRDDYRKLLTAPPPIVQQMRQMSKEERADYRARRS